MVRPHCGSAAAASPDEVRLLLLITAGSVAGCVSAPETPEKPVSIVEVNRDFPRYEGRVVSVEGDVGVQNEQPEIWTSFVYAIHMFGPPRAENCIRLDFSKLAGERPRRGGKYRLTGTVISAAHLPKAWGIACPSNTALRVTIAVQTSPY